MYVSVIRDELFQIRAYCKDLTAQEEIEILENNPEWFVSTECVEYEEC